MNYYINRDFQNAAPTLEKLEQDFVYFGTEKHEIDYSTAMAYMNIHEYQKAF